MYILVSRAVQIEYNIMNNRETIWTKMYIYKAVSQKVDRIYFLKAEPELSAEQYRCQGTSDSGQTSKRATCTMQRMGRTDTHTHRPMARAGTAGAQRQHQGQAADVQLFCCRGQICRHARTRGSHRQGILVQSHRIAANVQSGVNHGGGTILRLGSIIQSRPDL